MKTRMNIFNLILLLITLTFSARGQQKSLFTQYKFHRLNEEHGLINNVVNDIVQDTLGYIWVATEGGMARFLGNSFHTYKWDRNDVNSLSHNLVHKIYVDKQNQVWALTAEGVAKYSYITDNIVRYKPELVTGSFTSMAEHNGDYFFGRYHGGVLRGNREVKLMNLADPVTGQDFSQHGIVDMTIVNEVLWVATRSNTGIFFKYDFAKERIEYFEAKDLVHEEEIRFFDIHSDKNGNIWFASNRGLLIIRDGASGQSITNVSGDIFPKDDYLNISEDNAQNMRLGTRQNGMFSFRYNADDQKISEVQHFIPKEDYSGISHRTISKIYQDERGLIWLGTHNGGINVFNPAGEKVRFVTHKVNEDNSLSYENVWGIAPSASGKIWVGTDGKGINLLDPETGEITHPDWPQLGKTALLCAFEDNRSRLWLGTYEHGLFMINLKTNEIQNFIEGGIRSELTANDIRSLYQMDDGTILIGTNFEGLYYYNEDTREVLMMEGSGRLDVRTIQVVDDVMYLGTFNQGLVRCNLKQKPYAYELLNQINGERRLVITSSYRDGDTLWIATRENGLVGYDIKSGNFRYFAEDNTLRNLSISGISFDNRGNIWLTTDSGIYVYEKKKNAVKLFNNKDGIQQGHFNYHSIFLSDDGYMVVGGIKGMNLFYPARLLSKSPHLTITFDEIKVLNEKMTPVNSEIFVSDKSIFLTDKIYLDHNSNVFSLSYSTPGFNVKKQNEFTYMLDGYDQDWQLSNESDQITYKNVPYGSYTFKIKSIYNDEINKDLGVIIVAPWWRTWQAYLLFFLVLAFSLWRFIKFYNVRIALRQQLKFEQELREKDHLNMQEKLRFYTNFSHELKTPLTLIQGPVNDLIRTIEDQKQKQYLQLVKKNTNVLLKFIGRMLEFRKIEMNKTVLNVGFHDMKILAQEEAESFGYLAREKGIKFGFYCENDLNIWVDIEKIQIVMNNLLSNAFKFSGEGGVINFGVFHEGENLVIEVRDQGIGIQENELKNIFSPFYQASNSTGSGGTGIGLALCKSFVELHGGSISVDSKPNNGARFQVHLPLGKAHLQDKPHVRFIQVVTEEIESDMLNEHQQNESSEGITDADKVIMVVDDNKDISIYIRSLFEDKFKVIVSDNAAEALDKAIKNIPDIIISDMMMPGMDGLEFCRKLKENVATSHVPVILLTAKNSSQAKLNGYEVGADDYITKPFNSDLLIARVKNLLGNRKLLELKYGINDLVDPQTAQNTKEVEFILKAESVILEKLEQSDFNVPDLCKELGMSQTSLYRKIKSITGVSIQLFIRKIKIKRAAQLLISEDSTVTEIAFSLDFSDLKYFRKCFKDQFKMTPSEYKEAHKASIKKAEVDI